MSTRGCPYCATAGPSPRRAESVPEGAQSHPIRHHADEIVHEGAHLDRDAGGSDRPCRHGVFQAALALGAPWGQTAWGGAQAHLPPDLRVGSAISAVVLAFAALVVLVRAGHWGPARADGVFRWDTGALVRLLALSALGNFASARRWESLLMGPPARRPCDRRGVPAGALSLTRPPTVLAVFAFLLP
jgi:hypothetical protein